MATRRDRQTVVIAGNGMTSWRLCHELAESGAAEHLRVIVIGEERHPAYDRVRLTSLLSGTRSEDLFLATPGWYARAGIELHLGERVVSIDRDECAVTTTTGNVFRYDRLVLATGSVPFVPPIAGAEGSGSFVYRTVDDVEALRGQAERCRTAVVIGGGLLGLEAARAVHDLGLAVQIVEAAPWLMPRQLDAAGGALLRREIERLGIKVHVGRKPVALDRATQEVRFASGDPVRGELVVLAAGVRPASELARAAGLEVAASGGVVVDDELRTSDDRIFAAGECAAHEGVVYGLVAPGVRMARVLVANLVGTPARFGRQTPAAKLKLLGIDVCSVGETTERGGDVTTVHQRLDRYRKLIVRDGRLVGALGVGSWPGFDRISEAVQHRQRLWPWGRARFRARGELGDAPTAPVTTWQPDAVVCACSRVTRREIERARDRAGCELAAVCRATSAGTVCGSCVPLVEELVSAVGSRARPIAFAEGSAGPSPHKELGWPLLPRKRAAPRALSSPGLTLAAAPSALATVRGGAAMLATDVAHEGGTIVGWPVAPTPLRRPLVTLRPVKKIPRRETMPPFQTVPGTAPLGLLAGHRREPALLVLALLALALLALGLLAPLIELPPARLLKLVTGWSTVGLAAAAALLSLRKRWRRFTVGSLPGWRVLHAAVAVLTLASVALHTGLTVGENLNRALLVTYLAVLGLGAVAGLVQAGGLGRTRARLWLRLHLVVLAPLPALLVLHVLQAYFYG